MKLALLNSENKVENIILSDVMFPNSIEILPNEKVNIGYIFNDINRFRECYTLEEIQMFRKAAYPPIEEFADAFYWQSQGDNSKMEVYLQKVEQVKLTYPKPEA